MARCIGVLQPDQAATDSPDFFEKKSIVHGWIRRAQAVWIVKNRIAQTLKTKVCSSITAAARSFRDGPLGVGNLLPFSREKSNGDKLHYETPMAGDRSIFARHRRSRIRVSSRSQVWPSSRPQIPFAQATA